MSQDNVSDGLNQIMNAKRAKKTSLVLTRFSRLLIRIIDMMKEKEYLDYEINDGKIKITLKEVTECKAIKPRYTIDKNGIEKYARRFLPARNLGVIIVSTSRGLMTHQEAMENKIGGSLIAYFY